MKFYYMLGDKKVYRSLKRGDAEWCNYDCPAIYVEGDSSRFEGWLLMSNCLVLEDGNDDLYNLARSFVEKSSKAFYAKYPETKRANGNGFLKNFDYNIIKYHSKIIAFNKRYGGQ